MTTAAKPTPLWTSIADALAGQIASGQITDRLPTEADLAARFGVNRHTVRRALAGLADQGLVRSRRGSGVFVTAKPVDYPLGSRVRFHTNLQLAGRLPGRRVLSIQPGPATAAEETTLALPAGALVIRAEGVSLADDRPIALFRSIFPADRLPGMADALRELSSVTAALARCGIADYRRAETRITAETATAAQALLLEAREGAPLTVTEAINADAKGTPVEWGTTWFVAGRVTLVLRPGAED